uniref:Uncharacterized protein n=1 Tax=Arion vulgaris TaxID=1028688 RepID=A0A0B7AC86_9EUPU
MRLPFLSICVQSQSTVSVSLEENLQNRNSKLPSSGKMIIISERLRMFLIRNDLTEPEKLQSMNILFCVDQTQTALNGYMNGPK